MSIDERIGDYAKLIKNEANPVFKMLYELNQNLLIKLKNSKHHHRGKMDAVRREGN